MEDMRRKGYELSDSDVEDVELDVELRCTITKTENLNSKDGKTNARQAPEEKIWKMSFKLSGSNSTSTSSMTGLILV